MYRNDSRISPALWRVFTFPRMVEELKNVFVVDFVQIGCHTRGDIIRPGSSFKFNIADGLVGIINGVVRVEKLICDVAFFDCIADRFDYWVIFVIGVSTTNICMMVDKGIGFLGVIVFLLALVDQYFVFV